MKVVLGFSFVVGIGVLGWLQLQLHDTTNTKQPVMISPAVDIAIKEDSVLFRVSDQGKVLPEGLEVRITLFTLAGPYVTKGQTAGQDFDLDIRYARAGLTPYKVTVGDTSVEGNLFILPGAPVTPLTMALGSRATRVGSLDLMSVVLHPLDINKNVSDFPVYIQATYPGGQTWTKQVDVKGLFVSQVIPAATKVGMLEVVAQSEDALAEKGEVDVLPNRLAALNLLALDPTTSGDERDTWRFQVTDARDVFENRVADGQSISFVGQGEHVNFFATRPLIQGRQELVLPSYGKPGDYSLYVTGSGFQSDRVKAEIRSLPDSQLSLAWIHTNPLIVRMGPILNASGAMVDDGTLVRLDIYNSKQKVLTFFEGTKNGVLEWTVPSIPIDSSFLELEVAGIHKRLEFPKLP